VSIIRYKRHTSFNLWIVRKWDLGVGTGLIWLRIETGGGQL